ncbi:hypothetical protein ABT369_14065 [Dactylosporangium sp. NPDC000244]|uniref:hypothetical protein n=1 Tax=Dactylosporangium sp. NPDC000244 TaxID=3154365 RepID=UPI0033308095
MTFRGDTRTAGWNEAVGQGPGRRIGDHIALAGPPASGPIGLPAMVSPMPVERDVVEGCAIDVRIDAE